MNTRELSPPPGRDLRRHQSKVASVELRLLGRRNLNIEAAITAIALLGGAAYAVMLVINRAPQRELVFAGLLCVATVALFIGLAIARRYFFVRGRIFFAIADRFARSGSGPLEHLRLSQRVFNLPLRLTAGALYGLVVGSAPFVLPGNYSTQSEQVALSAFLFFANCLTGAALFSLVQFFFHGRSLFQRLVVNMWSPENESTRILLGLARRLSLATIVYVSLSMTSILFSSFELGPIVLIYVIFSVSTIFFVVVVPYMAVLRRLVAQKRGVLRAVARAMESNTQLLVSGRGGDSVMTHARHLMELKRWAEEASYFPLRLSSVRAFASVAAIGVLPVVVDWLLNRA